MVKQTEFWKGDFGKEYTERNTRSQEEWDQFHIATWGITKIEMLEKCIGNLDRDIKILEVGCNTGMQLAGLQRMGFRSLYGIELQRNAVEQSRDYVKNVNIIEGSGMDIPYKDGFFDLVFTSGVLIHISPDNWNPVMGEMVRCSSKYIMGFEYYSQETETINYRGNEDYLWKADYAKVFTDSFPELKEVYKEFHKYVEDNNVDAMYILEKS